MFRNYFKTAFRNLSVNKVYSSINIVGLSFGLACAMLIILYIKDELSYDRFHKNASQVYRITRKLVNPDGSILATDGYTGLLQGPKFTSGILEIQTFVRLQNGQKDIKTATDIQSQQVLYVDTNFFSAFFFPLLSGNTKTVLIQPNSIVISEEMAKKQFGTAYALGETVLLKDDEKFVPYTVTGITKSCPQNSSIKFDVLLPLKVSEEDQDSELWLNSFLNTFVILNADANVKAVEAKMKKIYEMDAKEAIKIAAEKYKSKWTPVFLLQPFTDIHLSKDYPAIDGLSDASNPVFSYILSGIAFFILLIACINFVNLTVARSLKRAKEIGIRKMIGGDRKQLIIQFLGESFLLCFLAFVLAILLVQVVLPVFNQLSGKALALFYLFDAKLVAGYITLFIVTSLMAGFYPAIVLSGYKPAQVLYDRFIPGGKSFLQKSLVILQFALASFLIIVTLTIFSQFNYLTTEKLGYDESNLVVVNKEMTRNEARLFSAELAKNSNITGVAAKNRDYWNTSAKVNGETRVSFVYETVDESYISLLKIPVILGRNFSKEFPSDSTHSVLVNEAFVKSAGWKDPIGNKVNFFVHGDKKYTVAGVVKDYHFQPLSEKIKPQLFTMNPANQYGTVFIKIRSNSETASLQHIEKVFKNMFPLSSYSYIFRDQENRKNYQAESKWKQIMLFGTILTIFISCIGLFGLSVLSAEKRRKEIGIRKVLGASVGSVVTILSKDFLKLVIIALLLAMPLAWVSATKWLQNYPYRVTVSWWMFSVTGGLAILIALATVSFQAIGLH